jgi:hypothetical protein
LESSDRLASLFSSTTALGTSEMSPIVFNSLINFLVHSLKIDCCPWISSPSPCFPTQAISSQSKQKNLIKYYRRYWYRKISQLTTEMKVVEDRKIWTLTRGMIREAPSWDRRESTNFPQAQKFVYKLLPLMKKVIQVLIQNSINKRSDKDLDITESKYSIVKMLEIFGRMCGFLQPLNKLFSRCWTRSITCINTHKESERTRE